MTNTSPQLNSHNQGLTKPSRINRRRKRKWPDPEKTSYLIKLEVNQSDLTPIKILLCFVSWQYFQAILHVVLSGYFGKVLNGQLVLTQFM